MTGAEWLAGTDPKQMLSGLEGRAGDRKLRLFAVACCRGMDFFPYLEGACARAVEVAERFADGQAGGAELAAAREAAEEAIRASGYHWSSRTGEGRLAANHAAVDAAAEDIARSAETIGISAANEEPFPPPFHAARRRQAALLRDIFGNPFRPVAVDARWLTSAVVALARSIYEARAFDRLPILADALQDAGCDHPDILGHCRGRQEGVPGEPAAGSPAPTGPHVRGCWVVDLLLGKE